MIADALIDSNVLVAIAARAHEHHAPSASLLNRADPPKLAVAAHSYAEAYNTLTRTGGRAPYRVDPLQAWEALASIRATTVLVGLTPAQAFDTVASYARGGGIGARLYDRLIGEVAVVHGIAIIIAWDVAHMRGLFPSLIVVNPLEFNVTRAARR